MTAFKPPIYYTVFYTVNSDEGVSVYRLGSQVYASHSSKKHQSTIVCVVYVPLIYPTPPCSKHCMDHPQGMTSEARSTTLPPLK